MSRRSPFVIELTKEEQAELDARSKEYTSPYRDVVRARGSTTLGLCCKD